MPAANREGPFFSTAAASIACRAVAALSSTKSIYSDDSSASSSGEVAGKGSRRRCLRMPCYGTCSAQRDSIRRGRTPNHQASEHGLFRRAIESRFLHDL